MRRVERAWAVASSDDVVQFVSISDDSYESWHRFLSCPDMMFEDETETVARARFEADGFRTVLVEITWEQKL